MSKKLIMVGEKTYSATGVLRNFSGKLICITNYEQSLPDLLATSFGTPQTRHNHKTPKHRIHRTISAVTIPMNQLLSVGIQEIFKTKLILWWCRARALLCTTNFSDYGRVWTETCYIECGYLTFWAIKPQLGIFGVPNFTTLPLE